MNKVAPLYITVMEVIKEKIINGVYKIGDLIPTETELEREFEVSKITIRKAIEMLESDGYVVKRSGKGTTVISNSIFNKLSKGESFSNILNKEGFQVRKEKTEIEKIDLEPQNEMYKHFGDKCYKIKRVYYLDGKPYIHFIHYVPSSTMIEENTDGNDLSVYMALYKSGLYINKFHDEFFIDYPSLAVLEELNLTEGPLLGRKRKTLNNKGEVIEISIAEYNTKIHNYVINYYV